MKRFLYVPLFTILALVLLTGGQTAYGQAATMYVDGHVAVSGDGLSWTTAKKTIQEANIAGGPNTHRLILIRGDQIYYFTTPTVTLDRGGLSATERKIYRGVPGTNGMGRLPIVTGALDVDETSFTAVGAPYPDVYQAAYAGSLGAVFEGPSDGEWGYDWTVYAIKTSLSDVQSTASSRWLTGGTLYVHTSTGAHPTNFMLKTILPGNRCDISASYMSIENLEFRHMWDTTCNLVGSPVRSYISFYSNMFHSGNIGIRVNNCADIDISDNLFMDVPAASINVISNYATAAPANIRISGNTIRDGGGVVSITTIEGVNRIHDNIIEAGSINLERRATSVTGSDHVYNNLIYRPPYYGVYAVRDGFLHVFNNTIAEGVSRCIYLNTGATNAHVFNNVFTVSGVNSRCIHVEAAAQAGLVSSNNSFYATGGAHVGYWGGYRTTLADWQTATGGRDGNSISGDPRFVNAAGDNFRLTAPSLCRDAGRAALAGVNAPAADLDGVFRPVNGGFDMGAYEYQPTGTAIWIR